MSDSDLSHRSEITKLLDKISNLESRIMNIESKLGIDPSSSRETAEGPDYLDDIRQKFESRYSGESFLETRIGEYGLAWIGNIVLLFGITFITGWLNSTSHPGISALIGYSCVALILFLSERIKRNYQHMGYVFYLNGHILLYYITLRLHFFSASPLLQSSTLALILLLLVVIVQVVVAFRSESQTIFGLAVTAAVFTAIVSDSTHIMLPVLTLTATTATWLLTRFTWKFTMNYSIILVYTGFLMWFLGNPIMGHPYGAISDHHYGAVYVFLTGAIYSLVALAREKDNIKEEYASIVIILNGFSFSVMLALLVMQFYIDNYIGLFIAIMIYCLAYSVVLKTFSKWKFTSASYALYGFVAMSIALYGLFGLPDVFLLLALQSLLVVSFALWFRNKIIVIMNAMLLISLLLIYLATSEPVDSVNFSFAIVTLLTARILNWKKERMDIQTEMLRNIFLVTGFLLVLFAFYEWAPRQYITLFWTASALVYFVLSIILHNVKYRYMALGTLIVAAFYLLIVDLAKIEILYRVLTLLFLAFISIGISIFYSRNKKKQEKE